MSDRLLTVAQAADFLHVNPETVRRYLRTGKLAGVVIARKWLIRQSELAHLIGNGKPVDYPDSEKE